MAKKDDWVVIHSILLDESSRAPQVPDDTKKVPLEMWTKGFLLEDAEIGDEVTIKTVSGRLDKGKLVEVNPTYKHNFGDYVPEIRQIDRDLREALYGGGEK